MQIHLETGALNREALVLPFQRQASRDCYVRTSASSRAAHSALFKTTGMALREGTAEQLAWACLMLSSLAMLLLSFWL